MMRKVEPDQIDELPVQVVEEGSFGCTPEELFASFERDEDWKEWLGINVERTTEGPYCPGFTRTVRTTTITLHEVFTVWSAPAEIFFYVERSNNPFLTAFAERYTVTELGLMLALEGTAPAAEHVIRTQAAPPRTLLGRHRAAMVAHAAAREECA